MKDLANLLKREIVALLHSFLVLMSRAITIKISEGKEHNRIILVCWLAGLSCKPTFFISRRKTFNQEIDIGSQKRCFYLMSFPQGAD